MLYTDSNEASRLTPKIACFELDNKKQVHTAYEVEDTVFFNGLLDMKERGRISGIQFHRQEDDDDEFDLIVETGFSKIMLVQGSFVAHVDTVQKKLKLEPKWAGKNSTFWYWKSSVSPVNNCDVSKNFLVC